MLLNCTYLKDIGINDVDIALMYAILPFCVFIGESSKIDRDTGEIDRKRETETEKERD